MGQDAIEWLFEVTRGVDLVPPMWTWYNRCEGGWSNCRHLAGSSYHLFEMNSVWVVTAYSQTLFAKFSDDADAGVVAFSSTDEQRAKLWMLGTAGP